MLYTDKGMILYQTRTHAHTHACTRTHGHMDADADTGRLACDHTHQKRVAYKVAFIPLKQLTNQDFDSVYAKNR